MGLIIELEGTSLIGGGQVNGQVGDAQDRTGDPNKAVLELAFSDLNNYSARNCQISVFCLGRGEKTCISLGLKKYFR